MHDRIEAGKQTRRWLRWKSGSIYGKHLAEGVLKGYEKVLCYGATFFEKPCLIKSEEIPFQNKK